MSGNPHHSTFQSFLGWEQQPRIHPIKFSYLESMSQVQQDSVNKMATQSLYETNSENYTPSIGV